MKKAQIWVTDFMVAASLFVIAILISIQTITFLESNNEFENLYLKSYHATNILLNSGNPDNWNETNVVMPGILTNNRLNTSKLLLLKNLPYEFKKRLLLLDSDFLFVFQKNDEILNITSCSYGYNIIHEQNCSFNLQQLQYDDLIIQKRLVLYEQELIEMMFYAWQ